MIKIADIKELKLNITWKLLYRGLLEKQISINEIIEYAKEIDQYCSGVQVNAMIAQRTKLGYPDSGHEKQFNDCGVTQCMHLPIGSFGV